MKKTYRILFSPWYSIGAESLREDGEYALWGDQPGNPDRVFETREEAEAELEHQREKYPSANGDFLIEEAEDPE